MFNGWEIDAVATLDAVKVESSETIESADLIADGYILFKEKL